MFDNIRFNFHADEIFHKNATLKKYIKKKLKFDPIFSPKTYFFQNVENNSYFHSETIFTQFWTLLDLKTHFEKFFPAGFPLEAQTSNASTAFLKHIFKS